MSIFLFNSFWLKFYSILIEWVLSRICQTILCLLSWLELSYSSFSIPSLLFENFKFDDFTPSLKIFLDINSSSIDWNIFKKYICQLIYNSMLNLSLFFIDIMTILKSYLFVRIKLGFVILLNFLFVCKVFLFKDVLNRFHYYLFWGIKALWNCLNC